MTFSFSHMTFNNCLLNYMQLCTLVPTTTILPTPMYTPTVAVELMTTSVSEPEETSILEPLPTQLGITTAKYVTTDGPSLSTDAEASRSNIPVYVWPVVIIDLVAVIVAIVLAIIMFWRTKRNKYVIRMYCF